VPLGVDLDQSRPDHRHHLPGGATVVFFTDGLVEDHARAIDEGLRAVAELATANAGMPPDQLCRALADDPPSDGTDDMALLAITTPGRPGPA
jgi:serine phosphatase RsbU (regulator of sigma subunit)